MGTAKLGLLAGLRKIQLTPRESQRKLMQGSPCGLENAGSRNLPLPHCHLPWSLTCLGVSFLQSQWGLTAFTSAASS